MSFRAGVLVAAILLCAGDASAASRDVLYGPAPPWVAPPPSPTVTPAAAGAPVRVVYLDSQTHLSPGDAETYTAYRLKILTPQGLAAGNLSATWNPGTDDLTINGLKIIRGDQVIDVLETDKFRILEREDNLAYSVLDGALTAVLQAPGLQIGDEILFAVTLRRHDTIFGDRAYGAGQLPVMGQAGAFRTMLSWDDKRQLAWRASPDLGKVTPTDSGGRQTITLEMRDPASSIATDGAPPRYAVRRSLEFSQFQTWGDLSHALSPMFERAETLAPTSPVRAEAARIAAASSDPAERAQAALKLVQEQIRYVYVGLDGGNYRPFSADDTWTRRFGDCKAKTVLLIALLRALGIDAEPVLVNSQGGDGTNEHLPTPAAFDHVLVRIVLAGKTYWLDGTRLDDSSLSQASAPAARWALPLRSGDVDLERLEPQAALVPQMNQLVDVDATAGFDTPAKVRAEDLFRGDAARQLKQGLAGLAPEDAQRQLEAYWRGKYDWVEPAKVSWRFDDFEQVLVMSMNGEGKPDWEGNAATGHSLTLIGAGFSPPSPLRRPKEQDQAAPWATDFPAYRRWTTIVRLPPTTKRLPWTFFGEPVHRELAGVFYWREIRLNGNLLVSTMSKRDVVPEITAAQAQQISHPDPPFDNNMSEVVQLNTAAQTLHVNPAPAPVWNKAAQKLVAAADVAMAAGRQAEALSELDQAHALEPESAAILKARGAVLAKLGRHLEALADFDEAWRINPLDAAGVAGRTQELRALGRVDEASLAATGAL